MERKDKILKLVDKQTRWTIDATVAHPDYKAASVYCHSDVYTDEYAAYNAAMELLMDKGVIADHEGLYRDDADEDDRTAEDLKLHGLDAKHWNNWQSTDVVRHTIESAKALIRMANEGIFDDIVYSGTRMDMPAFAIKIKREPFVFVSIHAFKKSLYGRGAHTGVTSFRDATIETASTRKAMAELIEQNVNSPWLEWRWTWHATGDTKATRTLSNEDEEDDDESMSESDA